MRLLHKSLLLQLSDALIYFQPIIWIQLLFPPKHCVSPWRVLRMSLEVFLRIRSIVYDFHLPEVDAQHLSLPQESGRQLTHRLLHHFLWR